MHEAERDERDGSTSVAVTEPVGTDEMALEASDPDFSTARALLKHVGTWVGDDLEEVLAEVYATRSKTRF